MEMPCVGLRRWVTPSRHSGDNSLSPKEPRSSDIKISTRVRVFVDFVSPVTGSASPTTSVRWVHFLHTFVIFKINPVNSPVVIKWGPFQLLISD